MENTLKNKAKFFAQYWSSNVAEYDFKKSDYDFVCVKTLLKSTEEIDNWCLYLAPLSMISDEDAIEVASLCYPDSKRFIVDRSNQDSKYKNHFLIHVNSEPDNINLVKHISINKYCAINANWHFGEYQGEKPKSFKVNLGEQIAQKVPIPMYAIIDFLRSKGYALPFMGLSVEQQIEYGWSKLKQK